MQRRGRDRSVRLLKAAREMGNTAALSEGTRSLWRKRRSPQRRVRGRHRQLPHRTHG